MGPPAPNMAGGRLIGGTAASVVCISLSAESSRARSRWDKMGVAPDEGGREPVDGILPSRCDNRQL